MVYDVPKLLAGCAYAFVKDIWLYLKDKKEYVEHLEANLTDLTAEIQQLNSKWTQIERRLDREVSKEKGGGYDAVASQLKAFREKYDKFVNRYDRDRQHLAGPDWEVEALLEGDVNDTNKNAKTARRLIDDLQARESTICTCKFFALAELSREIKELKDRISHVKIKEEDLLLEKVPEHVQVMDVDVNIPSFSKYVDEVLGYLDKDEIRSIGIVGQIGVGKTTVLKMLNNRLKDTNHGIVIWIDYPMQQDTEDKIVEAMQDVIIRRLKLIRGETETKADIISTALCDKKYILLIDQFSLYIGLEKVGIHEYHKFGKVVVASGPNSKVIKQMTSHLIQIQALSEEDAFILFQKVCGKIHDTRIARIARQIIKSCGGLPPVIMAVAEYLKDVKDENGWKGVKGILQSEPEILGLGGVGNAYKMVYDGLQKSYMKKCLLFGALFPSNHKIYEDYLVECWKAERFLNFLELSKAREHGAVVLRELTARYLLEQCSDKYVKMPVYFRKVALQQQYPDEENCENWAPAPETNELPSAGNSRTVKRISLIGTIKRMASMYCKPNQSTSPESDNILTKLLQLNSSNDLSTLLLQGNPELVIEDSLFVNMKNLRILDLNRTGIESLPSSIASLVCLSSLYLNDCSQLSDLPTGAEQLKSLEFFDIRRTSIPKLPNAIGFMVGLKCLRVSLGQKMCNRNSKGKEVAEMIPRNILSKLEQLEELTIETGCCSQSWNTIADQRLEELANLKRLTTLSFHFPCAHSLKNFVTKSKSWNNTEVHCDNIDTFRSFNFSIGCLETQHPYGSDISRIIGAERQLRFSTNEVPPLSIKEVLRQASAFELVGNSHVNSLSEFALENAGSLQVCIVESCKNLQSIIKTQRNNEGNEEITEETIKTQRNNGGNEEITEETTGAMLQCLEKLHLFDLQSLTSIWDGSGFSKSLSSLKILTLCGCPRLMAILNPKLAEALSSLEHLKVEDCSCVADIVKVDRSNSMSHGHLSKSLQRLETIELVNLPELKNICSSESLNWKSLRKIVVRSCSKLGKLSFTLRNAEKLKIVQCEYSWWTQLQWRGKGEFPELCLCFFEPAITTGAFHEEESSSNQRSVDHPQPQASGVVDVQTYNSEASTSNIDAQEERQAEGRRLKGKNIIIQ